MRFKLSSMLLVITLWSAQAVAAEMKVTLLGTGTPTPRLSSLSASTLIEAGQERLIFDLGRGSTIRLFASSRLARSPRTSSAICTPIMWWACPTCG